MVIEKGREIIFDMYINITETHRLAMVIEKGTEIKKGIQFCEIVNRV